MAKNVKNVAVENTKEEIKMDNNTPAAEVQQAVQQPAAEEVSQVQEAPVAAEEKPGFFKRLGNGIKKIAKPVAIGAAVLGVAIGAEKLGEHIGILKGGNTGDDEIDDDDDFDDSDE